MDKEKNKNISAAHRDKNKNGEQAEVVDQWGFIYY